MYILWSSDVHQKWEKRAGNWTKMVRLDKMSKQEMERIWYKELLIRMIIGLQ
jgi:hypothetical protein